MTSLYNRTYELQLDQVLITGLRMRFDIEKGTGRAPNKGTIEVSNLAPNTYNELKERSRRAVISLKVGYGGDNQTLFLGNARSVQVVRDGPNENTEIEVRDGGNQYLNARVSKSYPPGTEVATALRDLIAAMGIGEGNLRDFTAAQFEPGGGNVFSSGTTINGQASRELTSILRSLDLRWSIQNGVLQIQRRGRPLNSQSVLLSGETGLIGDPSQDSRNNVTCRALIIPGLYPGRVVQLDHGKVSGGFQIRKAKYAGDTHASDWFADLTMRPF